MIVIVIPLALLLLPLTNIAASELLPFLSPLLSPDGYKTLSIFNTIALTLPRHCHFCQLIVNVYF